MASNWNCSLSAIKEPPDHARRKGISPLLLEALADLKERSFIPQPFRNIDELWRELDIAAPKPTKHGYWRLTNCITGSIIGIDSFCGRLVATDGVICCIIRADGSYCMGHLDYFDPVEKLEMKIQSFDSYEGKRVRISKPKVEKQPKIDISEFV
jgi:hypothetical protein